MHDFEAVLQQYTPMIHKLLQQAHIYKDKEDYKQIAMIALWQAWQNNQHTKGSFTAYAYTTIRGAIFNELRANQKHKDTLAAPMSTIEFYSKPQEEAPSTLVSLAILNTAERELIEAIYWQGYTLKEWAVHVNADYECIKKRKQRIIQKLRKNKLSENSQI